MQVLQVQGNLAQSKRRRPSASDTWGRPHLRPLESKDEEKPTASFPIGPPMRAKSSADGIQLAKGTFVPSSPHTAPDNVIAVETKEKVLAEGPME